MIQARNKLSQEELSGGEKLMTAAKTMTVPIVIPISLTCLIFVPNMPASFSLL